MIHKILNVQGTQVLRKDDQKTINGGNLPHCFPYLPQNGCFVGPEECNLWNLPTCPGAGDEEL
ncbi:hypothetical protein U6A24_15780 [Aquimarina gracilis]|uniref:Bacteriocin-like protein n=1 Tax=Aquimarina gracilis TaxID=874422 RepID=A0ABU5ZYH8_9FLAO|nr:hypothetical protein [Aquimarina gracilis]MEB3346934.1 hypothetical protein [Aquimarina gracilis]